MSTTVKLQSSANFNIFKYSHCLLVPERFLAKCLHGISQHPAHRCTPRALRDSKMYRNLYFILPYNTAYSKVILYIYTCAGVYSNYFRIAVPQMLTYPYIFTQPIRSPSHYIFTSPQALAFAFAFGTASGTLPCGLSPTPMPGRLGPMGSLPMGSPKIKGFDLFSMDHFGSFWAAC